MKSTRREMLGAAVAVAATSLVPDLENAQAAVAPKKLSLPAPKERTQPNLVQASVAIAVRERWLLDFGWKFMLGNACDPLRDVGFGANPGDFAKTGDFEFATDKLDDSGWRTLNLPHDWAVELPFVRDEALQSRGYKPIGRKYPDNSVGWYRRTFDLPATDAGRRVVLQFDGVFRSALVFLNGCFIGRHDDGYTPFQLDVSDFLVYGGRNFLVVRADTTFGDGWFYEGAGIYRHVWLTKTARLHLGCWESYVRSDVRDGVATLSLGTVVENDGGSAERPSVRWEIADAEGRIVANAQSQPQSIAAGGNATFTANAVLPSPLLWSPETPHLYVASVSVETDKVTRDAEQITFGVRTVKFDVAKGFFLNGRRVPIKGTCNHQDHAGVGVALPDRLQERRLAVLREMGCNAVRTAHNMPTPEWVEACERTGVMMLCETRLMSSNSEGLAQLSTMIKRFRNSPAIILWSLGNEEWKLQGDSRGERIITTMIRRAHELDPTRLCTAAIHGVFGKGVSLPLDVEGFNYSLDQIDQYHRTHAAQPIIGSETASTLSTRGIYQTDKLRNWVSAYDANHPSVTETAEEWWKFYAAREFLPGGFAWTGFDYRGEPTPYGWPSVSSQFGIVDMCGFPKDNFYYYKSWWGHEPVLHLFPHWNWEQRHAEAVSVWVHSNLDEVELFLNERSQGKRKVQPLTHLEWEVKYEPGVLEARGMKDGKVVSTVRRETTGAPTSIRLTADRNEIAADGEDIALIKVEVLDKAGRPVPTADNFIKFKIGGEGILLGVGNGDPNCQESDKQPMRSLFNGLAQLIVQSTRAPGRIHIEAYTEDYPGPLLPVVRLSISTSQVSLRPALA